MKYYGTKASGPEVSFYRQPPIIDFFNRANQDFIYIGSMHTCDPQHLLFPVIEHYWDSWLDGKDVSRCIALIEGGERQIQGMSLAEAIGRHGEAGYVTYHAALAGVKYVSPEPSDKSEFETLQQRFQDDEILHYYFVRQLHQWHRGAKSVPYTSNFAYLRQLQQDFDWSDDKVSLDHMEQIHTAISGRPFDADDAQLFQELAHPYRHDAVTNEVALYSNQIRDAHMPSEIKRYWDQGLSIFCVLGAGHLEMQEESLQKLLGC